MLSFSFALILWRFLDDFAFPLAFVAGPLTADDAKRSPLLIPHLPSAVTIGTCLHSGAVFRTCAMAVRTGLGTADADRLADAFAGLEEGNRHLNPDIGAPAGSIGILASGRAAKAAAEESFKNIPNVAHIETETAGAVSSARAAAEGRIHPRVAKLVITGAFLGV